MLETTEKENFIMPIKVKVFLTADLALIDRSFEDRSKERSVVRTITCIVLSSKVITKKYVL